MSDIYRSAEEVAVWSGIASSSSGEALRLLLAPKEPSIENGGDHELDIEPTSNPSIEYNERLLNEVFSRPSWSRSWAIQEIVCAKKVTLRWGSHSLDWEDMRSVDSLFNYDQTGVDIHPRAAAAALQRLRQDYLFGSSLELDDLLIVARHHFCSDRADKIFSLLSPLNEADAANQLLKVDYTKHWTLIFGLATQLILTKAQDLDILSYSVGWEDQGLRRWRMPQPPGIAVDLSQPPFRLSSWVPSWNKLGPPLLQVDLYSVDRD